jgi:invasion protein IalB
MACKKRTDGVGAFSFAAAAAVAATVTMTCGALAQAPAAAPLPYSIAPSVLPGLAGQQAGPQQGPPPAPQWSKICSPDATTHKNLCLVQEEIYADTGEAIASATIRATQDDPKLQFIVTVPPGVLIQPGVQVQIDNTGKPTPMMYSVCFPNACYADMDITADFLKPLRAGKQLIVASLDQAGQTETFPIPLAGFSTVYDGPGVDPNVAAAQSSDSALTSSLQAHADAARQALTNQQPAPK